MIETLFIPEPNTGCFLWLGYTNAAGYGYVRRGQRRLAAHRVYYEQIKGPIPAGMQLDHLCNNTHCVNPDHLQPVLPIDNHDQRRKFCKRGHILTPDNITGKRYKRCRICSRAIALASYHRRKIYA
jgi:hypothetical protein